MVARHHSVASACSNQSAIPDGQTSMSGPATPLKRDRHCCTAPQQSRMIQRMSSFVIWTNSFATEIQKFLRGACSIRCVALKCEYRFDAKSAVARAR